VMRNFQREARAIANVQHPNIVAVHDFGVSANGEPFLAMEYVDGPNMADITAKQRRMPVERIVRLCTQVAAGLSEAHSRGIVHC
ncbi:protein kinase, partial [Mycobacterium tuberculosis]|nr:protein kinase [Mycobacterium tuberculosis]